MDASLISRLRARVPMIRDRWEALMRLERVSSPLANPDTLVDLIPSSIHQVFAALTLPSRKPAAPDGGSALPRHSCRCVCNPYRTYFVAGEQALLEAFVLTQSEAADRHTRDVDLAKFSAVVRTLATREIEAFCAVCTRRCMASGCRFGLRKGVCPLAGTP